MLRDEVAVGVLIASLAAWMTLHLLLAIRLARTGPWWRGPVACAVPPLAPYWAVRAGHRIWAAVWVLTLTVWVTCRVFFAK
jgi:hypothetical protein